MYVRVNKSLGGLLCDGFLLNFLFFFKKSIVPLVGVGMWWSPLVPRNCMVGPQGVMMCYGG